MNFQFYCPQGHLLQADSTAAGSVISCPVCGTQFIIPEAPKVEAPKVSAVSQAEETEQSADLLNFSSKGQRKSTREANLDSLLERRESVASTSDESENPLAQMTRSKSKKAAPKTPSASTEETRELLTAATKKKKKAEELDQFRIPCPEGHVLDVDREMLGERVQCPICHAVYDLKLENSLEYIKEKKEEEELEEARLGKIWIQRSIIAGILLVLFLIFIMLT